jgi:hypothetical protein
LTSTQAIVKTYTYHVISNLAGTQIINQNYPAPSYQLKVGISIYTYDPSAVGMQEQNPISGTSLGQPFPNPANDEINFTYNLDQPNKVLFAIYDVAGQLVKTVSQKEESEGLHTETISVSDLANGVYFLELTSENGVVRKKNYDLSMRDKVISGFILLLVFATSSCRKDQWYILIQIVMIFIIILMVQL